MATDIKKAEETKVEAEEPATEVVEYRQATLAECLEQMNKTRKAELELRIAEEKAVAEARAKVLNAKK